MESGQASRGIAQLTPGTGKLESLQASGSGIGQQMSQNKEVSEAFQQAFHTSMVTS